MYKTANGEGYDQVPDAEVPITSGQGQNLGATLQIEYGCGNKNIVKPFIWVEGFNPPEFGVYDYGVNFWDSRLDFYEDVYWQSSFVRIQNILQSNGYDIIYIDFDQGAGDMYENAKVVMAALEWVNAEKAKNNSNEQNVIWGESMGGVLAHIALSEMEAAQKQHDCKYYVSFDAPHLGANIPLGFQHMINHFQNMIINGTNLVNELPLGATVPNILNVFNHKSTKQLLIYNAFHPNSDWVAMQLYLATLPLPSQTEKNIAIANGNGQGNGQGYNTLDKMLNIDFKNQQFANAVNVNDPTLSWLTGAAAWWFAGTRINVQADVYAMPGNTSTSYRIYRGKAKVIILGYELIKVGWKEVKAANAYPFDNCPGGVQGDQMVFLVQ